MEILIFKTNFWFFEKFWILTIFEKVILDISIMLYYLCPTKEMIADVMTKPLPTSLFLYLRDYLLGYKLRPEEGVCRSESD